VRQIAGVVEANTTISLPPDMTWLMRYGAPTKLFVRKAYLDLVDIIFGPKAVNKDRKFCVTGTPGTGKTCLNYFLFYWCAMKKRRVVVTLSRPAHYLIFDCESDHVDVLQTAPLDLIIDPSTVFLYDAEPPDAVFGPTVLTTSPNQSIYKDFIRMGATFLYMPVWSLDELRLCKRLCDMQISDDEIEARFKMSVSIPRSLEIPCGQFWR